MVVKRVEPYGTWTSPITSELVVAETIGLGEIRLDGEDVYWTEMRPSEGGRTVLVQRTPDGAVVDVTPPEFNVRSRVHEYGGAAWTVAGGTVYFSNWQDQRLYRQDPGQAPRPITPEGELRYANGVLDQRRGRMICVREDHTVAGMEATNTLVALDLDGVRDAQVLVSGHDFYASPRLSPDGTRLAWLAWNHPNMPWNGTELWVAEVASDGAIESAERIAGGTDESIFQPEWSPGGVLYFVSDQSGWWNLCRMSGGCSEPLVAMEAEFGLPQWVFGMSTYAIEAEDSLICAYTQEGIWHLARLDASRGELFPLEIPYSEVTQVRAAPGRVLFRAGSPSEPMSVVELDLGTKELRVLRRSSELAVAASYISIPQPVEFPTGGGLTAHGLYYPPQNRDVKGPRAERPPLLVMSHGGPTGSTGSTLKLPIQFWTSRGIAVLDVNYGGSTGYGRSYRERLDGQWGIVDVEDCVNGARFLVERDEVDGQRLLIRGGSAGGYTTLCALAFHDLFAAGASYYGVSDLEALARETHKFESRYLDRLVGAYPERRDLYLARSPIHAVENLSCPVIFFQGLEDRVVPPNQAERMLEALRAKGLPVAYVPFEGEQHGFRRAENIKRALDAELYFYATVFGFEVAGPVEPVHIDNL
jgi:dipeptidyl aminopeptidase/acylaminoacyl peptidase